MRRFRLAMPRRDAIGSAVSGYESNMVDVSSTDIDDWDRHWKDIEHSIALNPGVHYRRDLILTNLKLRNDRSMRLLDVGSGIGDFLVSIAGEYPDVTKLGLELSQGGVDVAQRRLPAATFIQKDLVVAQDDPAQYRGFATHALCSEVLEHVDDPVLLLKNARHYMADNCRLVVTVPGGPRSALDLHIGHRRHFTPDDISRVLADAGFKVEFAAGAGFPFFNVYRLLVILAGKRLVRETSGKPGLMLRTAGAIFRMLFRLNADKSRFGWQILAVATK